MYYGKVEICGIDTSKLKTLSQTEMDLLIKKSKDGDKSARDKIVENNLRLVLSIVQKFSGRGENPDDLFQVGCIGLIKSIDNFNTELNVKFSTYAVPMIIGEIKRYLRDNSSMRVSRSLKDLAYKAMSAKEDLSKKLSREPTIEEITAEVNRLNDCEHTKEEITASLDAIAEPVSLYDPVYSDSSSGDSLFLMDQIKDEHNLESVWLEDIALNEAMNSLGKKEKNIIDLRFYKGKTQMETADEIGISQAQVSRLEKNAIGKIKKFVK